MARQGLPEVRQVLELIKPQYVVQKLWELTGGDAFVTSDVGQHQMWAAQFYGFDKPPLDQLRRPRHHGRGPALRDGRAVREPRCHRGLHHRRGVIQMCIQELSTCLQYHLPIKIVNLNNRYLGMVRQWQEFFYQGRYAMSYMDALPDFVKLAESYGHVGMRIDQPGDVEGAIREALTLKDRLVFMDFITDQTENVYPMIPAGAGQNEMILL
jgi:acetolactate synthase I/II/III large subunit